MGTSRPILHSSLQKLSISHSDVTGRFWTTANEGALSVRAGAGLNRALDPMSGPSRADHEIDLRGRIAEAPSARHVTTARLASPG